MADTPQQLKAINILVHLHKAAKLVRPVNHTIIYSIEMICLHLLETLRQNSPAAFAQLEKELLSGENFAVSNEDGAISFSDLLDVILALDMTTISFDKNLQREEWSILINLPAKNPQPAYEEPAIHELVEELKTDQPPEIVDEDKPPSYEKLPLVNEQTPEPLASERKVDARIDEPLQLKSEIDEPVQPLPQDPEREQIQQEIHEEIQEQVPVSESQDGKNQLYEDLAMMEKVFTRLNALDGAIEAIPSPEQVDMMNRLSAKTAEWLETQTALTPEYKEICLRLQALIKHFISNRYFAEAVPLVGVFGKISSGVLKKGDKIREFSLEVLRNLATDNNINILFKEINGNDKNKKFQAGQVFSGFGNVIINKLLTVLQNANDSKVRIGILHIIQEMGQAAMPAIKSSINNYAPWYYLRNMAYLLGRIGDENTADVLVPLLLHKERRVRMEAFKSISQTGGSRRGPLLLSALPDADTELRMNIIEILGKIRYADAVPDLQDMLKAKTSLSKDDQISLQEKICKALGAIGSAEAIKTLSEVAESKSFLGIASYPKEVKYAAQRALEFIKRK
ncbi:MAG: HEAT repeat domain-containing protein [Smithella sp.]|nr:HEAT repeat domain-containing protein [Smithella sp.]